MMNDSVLLTAIIENAIDGIVVIDMHGRIKLANPSVCRLFGYHQHELIGCSIETLMAHHERQHHQISINEYLQTGNERIIGKSREVTALAKDGRNIQVQLAVSEMMYGKEVLFAGIIHDLTKEKQAEEYLKNYTSELEATVRERTFALEEVLTKFEAAHRKSTVALEKEKEINQMKTRFVSMASHEFRSPLTNIQLSASLIEHYYDRLNKNKILNHVKKIKESVGDLINTLDDFLSVEKIESGKVEPVYNQLDLKCFVKGVAEEMTPLAKKGQVIQYRHTGHITECEMDGKLLKHCLTNLLSNAIKYSGDNGFIQIETMIDRLNCTIIVKDNGIGIPVEEQENLFKAFFRAKNTFEISGTGLGLSIVQRYVNLLGGAITFESSSGNGSSFNISLPVNHAAIVLQDP